MDICLVTAPILSEFTPDELEGETLQANAADPPLGVLSLAAVLEAGRHHVHIVDVDRAYIRHPFDGTEFVQMVAEEIAGSGAVVYGFSSICSSYPLTLRIARALKSIQPDSTILLGGPQASVVDLATLTEFPFVDLILRGEAEHTLPALLEQMQGERRLEQVPGLTYRAGSEPRRNANAPLIQNLDELPLPAYHLSESLLATKLSSLELGRGCPFACTFCSTNDFFRRNFRLRSPERVLRDMRHLAATYKVRKFQLVHDMFTVDRKRVVAFCDAMIASGEGFGWSCSARTDCVDEQLLELMARAGCSGIFFGVEVGSEKMQKTIDKHLDLQEAEKVIDVAERLGIHTTVSLITGFPEETWPDVRQTLGMFTHSLRCLSSSPQLNVLAPLAETPLYSKYRSELVLDELCSDMSHQALDQREADLELIRDHPGIFPNFYLLPMPDLDRAAILELREFMLMGPARLRWLVVAIDQSTTDLLNLFFEWRERRIQIRPELRGPELRLYYRTLEFCHDFLAFLQPHSAGKHPTVRALLDYHEAVRAGIEAGERTRPAGVTLPGDVPFCRSDIPAAKKGAVLFEIPFDLQRVIDALKTRSEPVWAGGSHIYLIRNPDGREKNRPERISDWMACLLRACDGCRNIQEVVNCLSCALPEVDEPLREYAFLKFIERARAEGFIDVYRANAEKIEAGILPLIFTETTDRTAKVF